MYEWYPEKFEPFTDLVEARKSQPHRLQLYGPVHWDEVLASDPADFARDFRDVEELHLVEQLPLGLFTSLPRLNRLTIEKFPFPDRDLHKLIQLPTLRHLRVAWAEESPEGRG